MMVQKMIVPGTKWQPDLSNAGRAKYQALAGAIREGIASGQLEQGEKLPPVRDMAYRIGVTPGTVARAYSLLTAEGRLEAGVGRGTFVAGVRRVADSPDAPQMLDATWDHPENAHLMSPKMPDVGQSALMRDGLQALGLGMPTHHLMRYPTRNTDHAARLAFRDSMHDAPIGAFDVDDVVIAMGGQSVLVMMLQTILRGPSPTILIDELSYGGFRSAAALCRVEVVSVPWDEEGPIPSAFEQLVIQHQVQAFCTSAEVCNPTTQTTTPARREAIAKIATKYDVHVIDDDCYRLAGHSGPSYRALLPDLGWYLTSPSKRLTPSLRIGFGVAPKTWSSALARTATFNSFGVAQIITDLYTYMMKDTRLPVIERATMARVGQDVRAAVNALGGHRILWSEVVPFLWVELPVGWRAGEFCQAAEAEGIMIKPAEDFMLRDSRTVHAVRIAINGQLPHERFVEAMRTLRRLLDSPADRILV